MVTTRTAPSKPTSDSSASGSSTSPPDPLGPIGLNEPGLNQAGTRAPTDNAEAGARYAAAHLSSAGVTTSRLGDSDTRKVSRHLEPARSEPVPRAGPSGRGWGAWSRPPVAARGDRGRFFSAGGMEAQASLEASGPVSKGGQAAGMRFTSFKARSGLKLWHHDKKS